MLDCLGRSTKASPSILFYQILRRERERERDWLQRFCFFHCGTTNIGLYCLQCVKVQSLKYELVGLMRACHLNQKSNSTMPHHISHYQQNSQYLSLSLSLSPGNIGSRFKPMWFKYYRDSLTFFLLFIFYL